MEKWETANANEKILLSEEMRKLKETLHEREKRLNSEIHTLRKEKDDLFERVTSLDLDSGEDIAKLQMLIQELKNGEEHRSKNLAKENSHLSDITKSLQSKLV